MAEQESTHPFRQARVAAFVAVGLALYAVLYGAAELLVRSTGDVNPIHRIATAERDTYDWIVLGASHAMPLDFQDFGERIEEQTGQSVLNLAVQGTGPLYHRFVAERYFADHSAGSVLLVVDSFGFYSDEWNEERFGDSDLLSRTPLDVTTLGLYIRYMDEGVDPRAVLDYAAGFSKINNRERFDPDVWEAEEKFTRAPRPSDLADKQRIDYLYPEGTDPDVMRRYLDDLVALARTARGEGARVLVMKLPMPDRFRKRLPDEGSFDSALRDALHEEDIELRDYSDVLPEPKYYFDPDHLNQEGAELFLQKHLGAVLGGGD